VLFAGDSGGAEKKEKKRKGKKKYAKELKTKFAAGFKDEKAGNRKRQLREKKP